MLCHRTVFFIFLIRIVQSFSLKNNPKIKSYYLSQHCQGYVPSTISTHLLNASRDDDSNTALRNLFQGLTILSIRTFFLIPNLNLPWHNLTPLPLFLSLAGWEKRPTFTWLHPLFRELWRALRSSLSVLFSRLKTPDPSV